MAIEINTAADFIALKDLADKGSADSPIEIEITADLDFSEIENFEGLGLVTFYANLNGNGHTIKNLVIATNNNCYLLGYIIGTVRNLIIDNCKISCGCFELLRTSGDVNNIIIKNTNTFTTNDNLYIFNIMGNGIYEKISISGTYYVYKNVFSGFYHGVATASMIRNSFICADIYSTGTYVYTFLNAYKSISGGVINCFSRCRISGTVSKDIASFYFYYQNPSRYLYAANTVTATCSGTLRGLTSTGISTCISSFFDNTILQNANDDSKYGQPTENLKSVEWLRSQGWAI